MSQPSLFPLDETPVFPRASAPEPKQTTTTLEASAAPAAPIKKSFTAHANLVYQAMTRQAGTLGKAILEGVMNSIDAKATKVDITLTQTDFRIVDDGIGMQEQHQVDEYFAVLGTPHETDKDRNVKDAKYGEYRMGRGQIFAQGKSVWSTGPFQLIVDLKAWGLDFEQHANPEGTKGCSIHTVLYDQLTIADFQYAVSEIKRFCKYVDIPVFLNGKKFNTPPKERKWTFEDDTAYYQIEKADRNQTGVELYQQGVYVERVPCWQDGINGTVVTKERMTLNFARNQAMRNCPVYKAISKKLREFGERNVKQKTNKTLTAPERIAEILRNGEHPSSDFHNKRVFDDIQGGIWSMNQLVRARSKYHLLPAGTLAISFAAAGNRKGDKIMEHKQGIVLNKELLSCLEAGGLDISEENFLDKFAPWRWQDNLQYVPFKTLAEGISSSYQLIDEKKLPPKEYFMLEILQTIAWDIEYQKNKNHHQYRRKLRVGISESADGWTDGKTYIAIDQTFLRQNIEGTPTKLGNLIVLLLHEYCHDDEDCNTHIHGIEFYQAYHELSKLLPRWTTEGFRKLVREIEAGGKRLAPQVEKAALQAKLVPDAQEETETM